MEVFEIQKAKSVVKLQKKESVLQTKRSDRLCISSKSSEQEKFVKLLNEMPALRPEKIEAACNSSPTSLQLAEKMLSVWDPKEEGHK